MKEDFLLIRILKRLKPLFTKTMIDFEAMCAILSLKLTLDQRKSTGFGQDNNASKTFTGIRANWLMQAFVGIFVGIMMTLPVDMFFKVTMIAGINLFFMVIYMVSDFSNVLLDVRDSLQIMTKPVSPVTMNAAKVIHILYYMLMMNLAMNVFSIVFGVFRHGAVILIGFLVMMVFLTFFVVFLTTILYSFLLERFNGEKLKDIINVFQMVLSVASIVAYQFLGRMFEFTDFDLDIHISWWTYLMPPAWYGGFFSVIMEGAHRSDYLILAVLAIAVPSVLGIFLVTYILPRFENYLSKLQLEDGVFVKHASPITQGIYKAFAKDHVELAFMTFTRANLKRDRKMKLMIAPNHAMSLIFPFILLIPHVQGHEGGILQGIMALKDSKWFVMLYFSIMFMVINFDMLRFSEKYEAAFIYDSYPIRSKTLVLLAALKAYYLHYMLPGMASIGVVFLIIFGIKAFLGILFIQVMAFFILSLKVWLYKPFLPFSEKIAVTGNKNMGASMALMLIVGIFAAGHYFLLIENTILTSAFLACAIFASYALLRLIEKKEWV